MNFKYIFLLLLIPPLINTMEAPDEKSANQVNCFIGSIKNSTDHDFDVLIYTNENNVKKNFLIKEGKEVAANVFLTAQEFAAKPDATIINRHFNAVPNGYPYISFNDSNLKTAQPLLAFILHNPPHHVLALGRYCKKPIIMESGVWDFDKAYEARRTGFMMEDYSDQYDLAQGGGIFLINLEITQKDLFTLFNVTPFFYKKLSPSLQQLQELVKNRDGSSYLHYLPNELIATIAHNYLHEKHLYNHKLIYNKDRRRMIHHHELPQENPSFWLSVLQSRLWLPKFITYYFSKK